MQLLRNLKFLRYDLVPRGANFDSATGDGAHVLLTKRAIADDEPTKMESGQAFPKEAFAYAGENPRKWAIRLWQSPTLKTTARQVSLAVKALPALLDTLDDAAQKTVIGRVRAAWHVANPDADPTQPKDLPRILRGVEDTMQGNAIDKLMKAGAILSDEDFTATRLEKIGRKLSADRLKRLTAAHRAIGSILREASPPQDDDDFDESHDESDDLDDTRNTGAEGTGDGTDDTDNTAASKRRKKTSRKWMKNPYNSDDFHNPGDDGGAYIPDGLTKAALAGQVDEVFKVLIDREQRRHPDLSKSACIDRVGNSPTGEVLRLASARLACDGVPLRISAEPATIRKSVFEQRVDRLVEKSADATARAEAIAKMFHDDPQAYETYRNGAVHV